MTEYIPLTTTPRPLRLRVEDYLSLDASGAFEGYGKTELIDGKIYYMNAQHRPHARAQTRLVVELARALAVADIALEAVVEGSVAIPPHDVPEPDIVVTSEPEGDGPIPLASVRLLVEISDATVRNDLTTKAAIYAAAGVPEYWVVDLPGGKLHQMWDAGQAGYGEVRAARLGDRIEAVTITGLVIETARLG